MIANAARPGFTLVELLVTMAVIGIIGSVVTLAFRVPVMSLGDDDAAQTLQARRQALREGHSVTIDIPTTSGVRSATAYSDGSIVADSLIRIPRIDVVEPKRRQ